MKRYRKTITAASLILILIWAGGCAANVDKDTLADYLANEVVISGLAEEDFSISVGDLSNLEMVRESASASRANGEKVSIDAVGPLLDTLLAQYDASQSDFTRVRFTATDGYSIAVSSDVLNNREIILAVADGNAALSAEDAPIRVVIPGERAMYWVRHLCRIDFELDSEIPTYSQIIFFETAVKTLNVEEYREEGEIGQAVAVAELFDTYTGIKNDGTKIYLTAADGLQKTETEDNFLTGMIKFTGTDSPKFVSAALPEGMHIYDLTLIGYGETMFAFLDGLVGQSGSNGELFFSDLQRLINAAEAESYTLNTADGASYTLNAAEVTEAYLYLDTAGRVTFCTGPGGETIAGLLGIGATP